MEYKECKSLIPLRREGGGRDRRITGIKISKAGWNTVEGLQERDSPEREGGGRENRRIAGVGISRMTGWGVGGGRVKVLLSGHKV